MENVNLKEIIHFTDKVSIVVVTTAVIAVIVGSVMLFFPKIELTNKVELDYVINNDSLKIQLNDSTFSYVKIDPTQINKLNQNNQKLFGEIKDLVKNYEKRHDALLTESKKREDFISYAAAVFAFIISIASFFGFKSIKEMKKDALETATETSEKTAEAVAKEKAEEVAKSEMRKKYANINDEIIKTVIAEVKVIINKKNIANIDDLKLELYNLKKQIDDCCNNVNSEEENHGEEEGGETVNESDVESIQQDEDMFSDDDLKQ